MAITDGPGAQLGPTRTGHRHGRAALLTGIFVGCAVIVTPFTVQLFHTPRPFVVPLVSPPHLHPHEADSVLDTLGPRHHLPPMLPARSPVLREGLAVRVGDITEGRLRRTPGAGWAVVVRWDGRSQPLPTHGTVSLDTGSSWVSTGDVLYTRVATSTPGRYQVYGWHAAGASAYAPPTMVARYLGDVCFNPGFTDFGDCAAG